MAASMEKFLAAVRKNKFLKFGLPMLGCYFPLFWWKSDNDYLQTFDILLKDLPALFGILVVGGSFGLKEFRTLRYDIMDRRKTVDPETEERMNSRKKKEKVTVEGEFKKMEQEDLDTWHNIRGPRPWEDSKEYQDMQRENIKMQMDKKVEMSS